jgi:hypothetical protein
MPEGPAERGVEANRARARAGARHAESMDGGEHSGSIERVMAGRHAAAPPCRALHQDPWRRFPSGYVSGCSACRTACGTR